MRIAALAILSCIIGGCADLPAPPAPAQPDACARSEASYECQVQRYRDTNS